MRLITKRDKIKKVVEAWKDQEPKNGFPPSLQHVLPTLEKMDLETVAECELPSEILTFGLTWQECDECGKDQKILVELGHGGLICDFLGGEHTEGQVQICLNCLNAALTLLEGEISC